MPHIGGVIWNVDACDNDCNHMIDLRMQKLLTFLSTFFTFILFSGNQPQLGCHCEISHCEEEDAIENFGY